MFKEIFIKLCSEKGVSPSAVCREVGITPATYSGWDENSVPRKTTLLRISEYFGVPVAQLLGEPIKEKAPPPIIDDEAECLKRVLFSFFCFLATLYHRVEEVTRFKFITRIPQI